jgi:uncharacterized CHY-type Zn-finger protein
MGRVSEKNERVKLIKRIFGNIGSRADYFVERVCMKCDNYFACFPCGIEFEPKQIEECFRIPDIVKTWFQAKAIGVVECEQPLKISFRKLRV